MATDYINVNGQLISYEEAAIAPMDAGMMHGAGLFETMRVPGNGSRVVFRLRQHLERMSESAKELGITVQLTPSEISEMVYDLLEINGIAATQDARIRLTITRGDLHAATPEDPMPPTTFILAASPMGAYPEKLYAEGMTVIVSRFKQNPENPLTGHKSTSYFDRLLALREAQTAAAAPGSAPGGVGEALWFTAHTNFLAEGSISNVFVVDREGIVVTPPLMTTPSSHAPVSHRLCLPGITRQVAIECATALGMLPHERLLTIDDLLAAREVFLTNAVMGIMPVTRIEKHLVADGKVGETSRQLRAAYDKFVQAETLEVA